MAMISITAFYKFTPIKRSDLKKLQNELQGFGAKNGMRGLTLLAAEGINGTVCGKPAVIHGWKKILIKYFGEIAFKDSEAKALVFPRWFVKIRNEIVSLRQNSIEPKGEHNHLSPEEWNTVLEKEDVVVLDARNVYETKLGMFENAIDPKLKSFQEFPAFAKSAKISKKKKVMMYCTGGIRCEKALLEMEKNGYENVYQLQGGILAYLEKFPQGKFKGECFVFDHRVSVDGSLQPSKKYKTCPHCGDPGDRLISCKRCGEEKVICKDCMKTEAKNTCSKNCEYHYLIGKSPTKGKLTTNARDDLHPVG